MNIYLLIFLILILTGFIPIASVLRVSITILAIIFFIIITFIIIVFILLTMALEEQYFKHRNTEEKTD